MNGQTDIDAILNPHSAESDRRTYGHRLANVSTYGRRLLKIGFLGVYFDFYWGGWAVSYWRINNAGQLFLPGLKISWPLTALHPEALGTRKRHPPPRRRPHEKFTK